MPFVVAIHLSPQTHFCKKQNFIFHFKPHPIDGRFNPALSEALPPCFLRLCQRSRGLHSFRGMHIWSSVHRRDLRQRCLLRSGPLGCLRAMFGHGDPCPTTYFIAISLWGLALSLVVQLRSRVQDPSTLRAPCSLYSLFLSAWVSFF